MILLSSWAGATAPPPTSSTICPEGRRPGAWLGDTAASPSRPAMPSRDLKPAPPADDTSLPARPPGDRLDRYDVAILAEAVKRMWSALTPDFSTCPVDCDCGVLAVV